MIVVYKDAEYEIVMMPSPAGTIKLKPVLTGLAEKHTEEVIKFVAKAEVFAMTYQESQILCLNMAVSMEMMLGKMTDLGGYMIFQDKYQTYIQTALSNALTPAQKQRIQMEQQMAAAKAQGHGQRPSGIVKPGRNPMETV